jgi:hypothetical protein
MASNNQDQSRHGGPRKGAGRKAGSAAKKTREVANKAAESGITPLEVLLECMHSARNDGDVKATAFYANMAAPYMHPKLASITSNNTHSGSLTLVSDFPT